MNMFLADATEQAMMAGIRSAYRDLFSSFQNRAEVAKLGAADVGILFRAATKAQSYTQDVQDVRDMQLDLNALRERGRASQLLYIELNDALIGSRMFSEARLLERAHPGTAVEIFHGPRGDLPERVRMVLAPDFRDDTRGRAGPTEMVVTDDGRLLVRRTADTRAPAQIIVVISPGCHFAHAGLGAIETDPQLREAFRNHTIWLVPPTSEFDEVARWNRAHSDETMAFAFAVQEWPMLDRWSLPTFYFLRRGAVVAKVVGWPREGRKPAIQSALKRIGLL